MLILWYSYLRLCFRHIQHNPCEYLFFQPQYLFFQPPIFFSHPIFVFPTPIFCFFLPNICFSNPNPPSLPSLPSTYLYLPSPAARSPSAMSLHPLWGAAGDASVLCQRDFCIIFTSMPVFQHLFFSSSSLMLCKAPLMVFVSHHRTSLSLVTTLGPWCLCVCQESTDNTSTSSPISPCQPKILLSRSKPREF